MNLPNLEWRYVGNYTIGTGTISIATVLDGIYALATGTTYFDESPRVQGSGSAGTWSKATGTGGITEAIYMTPPSGNCKMIIAGSSGSASPDMAVELGGGSAYFTNKLFVNIVKNAGSYSSWSDSNNPFTSGNSMGYVPFLGQRNAGLSANAIPSGITTYTGTLRSYLFESKESIAVFLIDSTGSDSTSSSNGFIGGAIIDPQSTDPFDAETDGRLYGIVSTGHGFNTTNITGNSTWLGSSSTDNIWGTNWHTYSKNSTGMFLYGYNSSPGHCAGRGGVFEPRTGNVKPITAAHDLYTPVGSLGSRCLTTNSGKYVKLPILMKSATEFIVYGALRNIAFCTTGFMGQKQSSGSGTIGYVVSCSNNTVYPADGILLEY